jgi:protein-disulfide isomerase
MAVASWRTQLAATQETMRILLQTRLAAVIVAGLAIAAAAQTAQPHSDKSQQVKAGAVTINMPEGMTKDQADDILKELKAIHQLLERQQTAAAAAPARQAQAAPTSDKVKMSVAPGWYSLGRDDAPVTLVEFADYQCPFCRQFHAETFAELKKNYIDTGKVRYVSRDLPLDFHPNAPGAAVAARCAGEQHKFWEMRDLMVVNAADLSSPSLLKYGGQLNLDMTAFSACLSDKKYTAAVQKDIADAGTLGISGTPSFVVGKTAKDQINGVRIVGAVPYSVFETAIKNQLNPPPSAQ